MLKLKYKDFDVVKETVHTYTYFMKDESNSEYYFSDNSIQKALALYYYAKHGRTIMKVFNYERKNKNKKKEKKFVLSEEHKNDNRNILNFFDKYYINEEGIYPEKKEKYKHTFNEMITNSENEAKGK